MRERYRHPVCYLRVLIGAAILLAVTSTNALAQQSTLSTDQWLMPNTYLSSPNGKYQLWMQNDGNLVLYKTPNWIPLWSTDTWRFPGLRAVMQGDGNLVLYDAAVDYGVYHAYWASNTPWYPGSTLVLQDDGNLVIYTPSSQAVWASNTVQPTGCVPFYAGCTSCTTLSGGSGMLCESFSFEPFPFFGTDIFSGESCSATVPLPYAGEYCF